VVEQTVVEQTGSISFQSFPTQIAQLRRNSDIFGSETCHHINNIELQNIFLLTEYANLCTHIYNISKVKAFTLE
jgi:hypothetical protein